MHQGGSPAACARPPQLVLTHYCVVMRPMLFPKDKMNHRLPSGPAVMPKGPLLTGAMWNSSKLPAVVIRPMLPTMDSANHRLPSGPVVIPSGRLLCVGIGNSVRLPLVVMLPILFPSRSVNQRLLSGPAVALLWPATRCGDGERGEEAL